VRKIIDNAPLKYLWNHNAKTPLHGAQRSKGADILKETTNV